MENDQAAFRSIDSAEIEDICRQLCTLADPVGATHIATDSENALVQKFALAANFSLDVARRAVRNSNEAIAELRKIHRIARIGSWRVVAEDRFTTWSDEMHALVGSDPQSFIPSLDALLQLVAPSDRASFEARLVATIEDGQGATFEFRGAESGDEQRWFWTDMQPEPDDEGRVFSVHGICQDVTERKSAFERIRHLARHDPLTGLANRAHLSERLEHILAEAVRRREQVAVLLFNLDQFKSVNDVYGHAAGDEVLREIARRLSSHVRDTDIVARIGADEFVVIQTAGQQPDAAQRLAQRLLDEVVTPTVLTNQAELPLSASIGIAYAPDDATTQDDLLARADRALGWVKREGRNTFATYHRSMERAGKERQRLEHDLRLALQHGEFSLVFQPMLCTRRNRFVGFEALLRWHSPVHGNVSPEIFIGIAETIGIMAPLGAWVLRTACAEAAGWSSPLKIAVNVSPIQFQQERLAETITETLAETGLAPERLEIEVTESLLIKNPERTFETLRQIKALGVRIAMDDFGTGYSSLATLRAFPFDKLKVDRSFVKDLGEGSESLAIINAILGLGRGLRLPVVAEGVETEAQAAILRRCGADELQGYLLGKPSPIERFSLLTGARAVPGLPVTIGQSRLAC